MLMSEQTSHSHGLRVWCRGFAGRAKLFAPLSSARTAPPRAPPSRKGWMFSFAFGWPAMGASLTLSPVAMGRARPAPAPAWRTASSGRCSRLLMLTPDTSGPAAKKAAAEQARAERAAAAKAAEQAADAAAPAQISDEARASLRLPAGSPYMNAAASPPTAEEELQSLLDAPLLDPWRDTPDECSLDTPSGCMPG